MTQTPHSESATLHSCSTTKRMPSEANKWVTVQTTTLSSAHARLSDASPDASNWQELHRTSPSTCTATTIGNTRAGVRSSPSCHLHPAPRGHLRPAPHGRLSTPLICALPPTWRCHRSPVRRHRQQRHPTPWPLALGRHASLPAHPSRHRCQQLCPAHAPPRHVHLRPTSLRQRWPP